MAKTPTTTTGEQNEAGNPVDATGGAAVDPTANVRELVEAAIKRQDDLRAADQRLNDIRLAHIAEMANLRATHVLEIGKSETQRIDVLRDVQLQHVEQTANLREQFSEKLMRAEAGRINAIREVDVSGVATAAQRQDQQAVVLANQVATSAETLRALVATTNSAVAASMSQISTQLMERIAANDKTSSDRISMLEKSSYEGKGKEAVSDPMLARLYEQMKTMNDNANKTTGKGEGMDKMWAIIMGIVGAGGGGILVFLGTYLSK